jgi:hypothetical protein
MRKMMWAVYGIWASMLAGWVIYMACREYPKLETILITSGDVLFLCGCLLCAAVLIADLFFDDEDFSNGPAHASGGAKKGDSGHAGAAAAGSAGPGAIPHPDCAERAS